MHCHALVHCHAHPVHPALNLAPHVLGRHASSQAGLPFPDLVLPLGRRHASSPAALHVHVHVVVVHHVVPEGEDHPVADRRALTSYVR